MSDQVSGNTYTPTAPIRSTSLDQQTSAAFSALPNVNQNPTFVTPGSATPVGTGTYKDNYGRVATAQVDANGNFITTPYAGYTAPPPPKVSPPSTSGGVTLNTSPTPPDKITGDPGTTLGQQLTTTPSLSLDNLSGLLNIAHVGAVGYGLATSTGPNALTNTGVGAGFLNGVDEFGANNLGFANSAAGGEWANTAGQTSLTNAIGYGSGGAFVASLLGLSSGNFLEDTATGIAGGIAGAAAGNAIGGTLLGIGAGALGGFIGGFALTAIASLFGPRPSDMLAGGSYDPSTQSVDKTWTFQGKKYSQANNDNTQTFFNYVKTLQNNINQTYNGTANVGDIGLDLGRWTGVRVSIGDDTSQDFTNGQDALNFVGKNMLQNMQSKNNTVEYVRQRMDWNSLSFDQAAGAMSFANDFDKTAANFSSGSFNVDQNMTDSMATIDTWATTAKNLFIGNAADGYDKQIDAAVAGAKAHVTDYYQTHTDPMPAPTPPTQNTPTNQQPNTTPTNAPTNYA